MNPLVYIIIINFNNYNDTIDCVKSITTCEGNYKVIIIDNNSNNDSLEKLKYRLSQYSILEMSNNIGFAKACNIGINIALENKAEYVLLLNNDTIVKPDFLVKMLDSFKRVEDCGIVGGKVFSFYNPELICHAGGEVDLFKFITIDYGIGEKDSIKFNKEKQVSFVSGCCMLIKSEVFKKVGLLPEDYFMYYEDTDFCLMTLENKYKIIFNPEAIIYHKVSASSGGHLSAFSIKWNVRNRLIFMNKYKYKTSKVAYNFSVIYFYLTRIVRWIMYLLKNDMTRAKAIIDGIKEGRENV